jgi:hypothetical protein
MAYLVLHSHQNAAGHNPAGQNRPQGRSLHLEAGETEAHPTGGLLSRYRLGLIERELEVSLEDGPQQEAAWEPRDVSRRHAAEILPNEFAGGHSKADPDLYPLPGPLPMRFQVHLPVHFLIHFLLIRDEAFVLHGKANDCGPRHAEDGVPRLILHWAVRWAVPRERLVPVSLLPSTQPLVCLVAYPALGVEVPHPCQVRQWCLAGSCVPGDVRAAYPHSFLADRAGLRLVCLRTGAESATPFLPTEVWFQTLERCQAWE